jgi:FtsZ-binding cell division protein ZapB
VLHNVVTDNIELGLHEAAVIDAIDGIEIDVQAIDDKLDDESRFTSDLELAAHNTALLAGIESIESKLDNEELFTDDVELQQEIDDVQADVADVKQEVLDAHAHIEALIGEPSDIPSINNRKRDGMH